MKVIPNENAASSAFVSKQEKFQKTQEKSIFEKVSDVISSVFGGGKEPQVSQDLRNYMVANLGIHPDDVDAAKNKILTGSNDKELESRFI